MLSAPILLQEGGSSGSRGFFRGSARQERSIPSCPLSLGLLAAAVPAARCFGRVTLKAWREGGRDGREGPRRGRGRGRGGGIMRRRPREVPSRPREQERQRESVDVPEGWGMRVDGLKKPWNAPWYKKRMARGEIPLAGMEPEMRSLDRKPIRDFADALEQGKMEVLEQSNISAARSRYQANHPSEFQRIERKLWKTLPEEEKPTLFPHFRKAFDWDYRQGEKGKAPEHFFSQKSWSEIDGIMPDTASLAQSMQLPKPSRIQFLSFPEIAKGRSSVVADQSGSGKTLAYLLPLLQRYVLSADPEDPSLKLIVVAPTSDLVHQIAEVARVASSRSKRGFQVTPVVGGGGDNARRQRKQLLNGTDVVVATPGRLKFFMEEDYVIPKETWESCKAVVIDEVDALVGEQGNLNVMELKIQLPEVQWVFVTATVSEAAKGEIQALEAQLEVEAADLGNKNAALVWTKGPGLHRVPLNCEHVLIECTPPNLYSVEARYRLKLVMRNKIQALVWHMQRGILKDEEDNRVLIFCNTIENCSRVHEALEAANPDDTRSGDKQWKLLVLHGLRDKQEYEENMALFSSEKVPAADFFKRRIMICTDRLSRGMDFGSQPVKWVVLMDWPRDATEYIRRVGRTARAGEGGSVMTLLCGTKEATMGKQITAAAIRSLRLTTSADTGKMRCLERFDPTVPDWRSKKASAPKPVWKPQEEIDKMEAKKLAEDHRELTDKELRELFDEADMGPVDQDLWDDEEDEIRMADEGWSPWSAEDMADEDDEDLWDDNPFDEERIGISLQD